MGGALAFHFGYRFCTDLAGIFALSAFLNEKSSVYDVSGLSIYCLFLFLLLPCFVVYKIYYYGTSSLQA